FAKTGNHLAGIDFSSLPRALDPAKDLCSPDRKKVTIARRPIGKIGEAGEFNQEAGAGAAHRRS
ncbi:MAG TPA: hypothetical protein VMR25_04285, partial [Planctomycetaceae bacterium]|nr:hypothetical protein [Planctomycetaceae bacterium]